MGYQQWLLAAVLGAVVLPGCQKEEATPEAPKPAAAQSTHVEVKEAPAAAAAKVGEDAAKTATDAANQAVKGANTAVENTKKTVDDAASNAADSVTAAAEKKLSEVTEYIKNNKLDLADKTLKEVEANEASLPESIKEQIPTIRKTLDAAKTANNSGVKMPDMPGMGK